MNYYIQLEKSNCKNCYKCIRHCPVKSIRFADHQANIDKEQCILCGECFVACPQNAKQIRNDVARVKELLASGRPVYASLAPSFVANYEGADLEEMSGLLRRLGFAGAEETALGATIVKRQYEAMIRSGDGKPIISSCCHTVNSLIQKYYPEALPYLAKVMSPMQAHCGKLKEEHPDAYTVFLGPCISKKEEAEVYPDIVDCVLTFEELTAWFQEEGIAARKDTQSGLSHDTGEEVRIKLSPNDSEEGRARLFPITGGILRSMVIDNPCYDFIAVDGIDQCKQALTDIIHGDYSNCFIELSACKGSCVGGPAMAKERRTPLADILRINRYAREKDFQVSSPDSEKLAKSFPFLGTHSQMPGSGAIEEILHKMGKISPEQELNCGSCGYDTCREKAVAVYQGKADLTMCLPFLKEKAENFSDNIIYNMPNGVLVLNEALEVQQINRAAREILNIRNQSDILNAPVVRILNPNLYLEVMTGGRNIHDKRSFLADYQRYVEETVIYDKTYHIIISIMKDVTMEEKARLKKEQITSQSVEIADKVIEKQMRVVQEIASLLGETTAETKIALTNLKETLQNE